MAETRLTFFKSQRGGNKLALGGFTYCFDKERDSRTYWRCDQRKCSGAAVTQSSMVVSTKEHNLHAPDQAKVQVKFVVFMK